MAHSYDVFLSHTSRDKLAVRRLAEALRSAGLSVWFDEWELVPGASWQLELQRAIRLDDVTTLPDLHWIDLFIEEERALERFADGVRKQFRKAVTDGQLTSA